jgi:hypothetical protein
MACQIRTRRIATLEARRPSNPVKSGPYDLDTKERTVHTICRNQSRAAAFDTHLTGRTAARCTPVLPADRFPRTAMARLSEPRPLSAATLFAGLALFLGATLLAATLLFVELPIPTFAAETADAPTLIKG